MSTNPLTSYLRLKEEINQAVLKVLESGQYIGGEQSKTFEQEFAKYVGGKHCVAVNSGTDALIIALRACGIGAGDEVIVPSYTVSPTVAAVVAVGATPVFVDVILPEMIIDPEKIKEAITNKTKTVIPVHLFGRPCTHFLYNPDIIHDVAHAHDTMVKDRPLGNCSDILCYSFYPSKNLGAYGDAGAIVFNDKTLAGKARQLREYGWGGSRFESEIPYGLNTRMDEIQAAILRVKLKHLPDDSLRHRNIARIYNTQFKGLPFITPECEGHSYHQYTILCESESKRNNLQYHLKQNEIETRIYYTIPCHKQRAWKDIAIVRGPMENTEWASKVALSLPIWPGMALGLVENVVKKVKEYYGVK